MPLLLAALAGFGVGGWTLSQADDAIETATGERATTGLPTLQLIVLAGGAYMVWRMVQGAKA